MIFLLKIKKNPVSILQLRHSGQTWWPRPPTRPAPRWPRSPAVPSLSPAVFSAVAPCPSAVSQLISVACVHIGNDWLIHCFCMNCEAQYPSITTSLATQSLPETWTTSSITKLEEKTRQKGLHKQLLSDVINALASVYCYCLRPELTDCWWRRSYSALLTAFPCGKQ